MQLTRQIRHSVGVRLLAGFWLTIALAVICVWVLAQITARELHVGKLSAKERAKLNNAAEIIQKGFARRQPIKTILLLRRNQKLNSVILYRPDTDEFLSSNKRFHPRLKEDIRRLAEQEQDSPLNINRPPYQLLGPKVINERDKQTLLFLYEAKPFARNKVPKVVFPLLALLTLSIVFSIMFTRSLLRPIRSLQLVSQLLANGDLSARIRPNMIGRDELGELAIGFNEMAQKLSDNWSSQSRLLADVSHELRSPLTRLNMAIALAEQAPDDKASVSAAYARIQAEADKMEQMIKNLLLLSRTEAGMDKFVLMPIDEVLGDVLSNAQFEAQQKGIALNWEFLPSWPVKVQVNAIQSAVENIVRNGIYYANSKVSVSFARTEDTWQITISDDGSGLPDNQLESIFSPFYRADSARSQTTGGIGLGLAIAKAAVTAHHGQIVAENNPSGGLVVTLLLKKI